MATKTKTKPAAKKAAPKKTSTKKAAPAKKSKAPAKKAVEILEDGAFVTFSGYGEGTDKDDIVFEQGEILYIVGNEEAEDGIRYAAIKAEDVSEFLENGDENVEGGEVVPSEIKPLKGGALDKAREAYMPIIVMGKLAEMLDENDNAIEVAIELNQEIQETYFWLGGALAKVLQEGSHLAENGGDYEGDEAWNEFTQAEFGFSGSKGRQLARIYTTFSGLPDFDADKLAGIGWSIASKIEKYVTPENVEEVLDAAAADGVTQRTVDAIMKEKFVTETGHSESGRATSRGEKLVTKTMSFRLSEDSAEAVELAIQHCMKQNGIDSEALAIEHICTEWAQDHVETKTVKQKIGAKARKAAKAREAAAKK